MAVYFIQAGGPTGPVKIGHGDPQSRRDDCQVGNHLELRIIRVFEGGKTEEDETHARFIDLWIRGEWHNFTRTMLGDVGLVEIPIGEPVEPPGDAPVAERIGARVAFVSKWVANGRIPSEHIPLIIDAASRLDPPVPLQPNDFFATVPPLRQVAHSGVAI